LRKGARSASSAARTSRCSTRSFFRQWLIRERNYKGEGPPPEIPDEVRAQLAGSTWKLVRTLTGTAPKLQVGDTRARIEKALRRGSISKAIERNIAATQPQRAGVLHQERRKRDQKILIGLGALALVIAAGAAWAQGPGRAS